MQTHLPKHPVIPRIMSLITAVENNTSSTRLSTWPVELIFSTCKAAPGELCLVLCYLPDQREYEEDGASL